MKLQKSTVSPLFINLAAWLAIILVAMRFLHIFSFNEPLHVVTSGFEEESLFALFKVVHGMSVYTDPHQVPFAASYFNWFYYVFYGKLTALIINGFHLSDIWIPTVGRLLTFLTVSAGFFLTYRLLRRSQANAFAFGFSALLWFGPLVGYWAMTVRPDSLGLFFDVAAAGCLLHFSTERRFQLIILAALFCYLSWACKQINVIMPGAIGLFLLWRRNWTPLFLFSAVLISLYALTYLYMPSMARKMLFFVNTAIPLSLSVLLGNALTFFKKTSPLFVLLLFIVIEAFKNKTYRQALLNNSGFQFSLCGLITWSIILLPASSKVGSAENYYFIAYFFLTLLTAIALCQLSTASRLITIGTTLAGLLFIASISLVLLQDRTKTLTLQHQSMTQLQQCIKTLPGPVFVINHYGALPWMNPGNSHFVLAYNYWSDRQAGISFEQNGIGGLIEKGYFNALILPGPVTNEFDGANLADFERQSSCQGYAVFTRKGSA